MASNQLAKLFAIFEPTSQLLSTPEADDPFGGAHIQLLLLPRDPLQGKLLLSGTLLFAKAQVLQKTCQHSALMLQGIK
jgi:hypothetical protein